MILATDTDRPAIEAFLTRHIATSMFPLSNLRRYGMAGGHGRAVRFWCRWQAGQLTDVLTVSEEGFVMPNCPTGPWGDARVVLAGTLVKGFLGDGPQVAALQQALDLPQAAVDDTEPLYQLPLADLRMPDVSGFTLGCLTYAPRALVVGWRRAYLSEVLPRPGEDLDAVAVREIEDYAKADSHRLLYRDGVPVAMTGFNAVLPGAVQIGGVYTPPAFRSQGLARHAVALHLAEARDTGVEQANLFAASRQAARAYEAVGFRRAGDFAIVNFEEPQVIHG